MSSDPDFDTAEGMTAAKRVLLDRVLAQFMDEIFGKSAELEWTELPDGRPGLVADDVLFALSPSGDELQVVGEMESGNPGIVAFDRSGAIKCVGEVIPPDPGEAAMN